SNIFVTKTTDKTTANVGDTLTYTVTVGNNGPANATGVVATDILPGALNFISASSTRGSYATTTGMWTIGDLVNGSSTALTLVATITDNSQGQKITNTAMASSTQTDPDTSNNTSSTDVTVNNPGCTSNCGGGGGGGGGNTPTSNISVTKTADKTSANVGDTVT